MSFITRTSLYAAALLAGAALTAPRAEATQMITGLEYTGNLFTGSYGPLGP